MQHIGAILFSLAAVVAAVPAGNLPRAASLDKNAPFQIYAYGDGIGGLPLFSAGVTPAANNVWQGAPNTTATPGWSNLTFFIPAVGASNHSVGFVNPNSTASDRQTRGFMLYGDFVFVEGGSDSLASMWYATPSSTDGIYSLKWNETGDSTEDKIVLALKKTVPSTALFPSIHQV
ncbi:hypothetical protein CSUB01_07516 [Colletotrichum sublineola]|uniref:Cytochrome P450 n=1 Tax=Colletotrichum sublineola TaxID=1173701 RepID=A0A066XTQ1_COLSU|nr:hypothetical protein CSUB01_07516 [Colletotrichum sublineola]